MDEYDQKFADMQKYIPFLEAMIARLTKAKERDPSREEQLGKMRQLHGILSSSKRKLKLETLIKCEDVLQKLHSRVGKETDGLSFSSKKNGNLNETSSESSEKKSKSKSSKDINSKKLDAKSSHVEKTKIKKKMDETPASPSPPASPDRQGESTVTPIIIPTERKNDYPSEKADSKPASPEPCETISTAQPIIIPTERKDEHSGHSKRSSNDSSPSKGIRKFSSDKSHSDGLDKDLVKNDSKKNLKKSESLSPSRKSTLLLSKPELSGPPLSMEDLAELLNEDSNKKSSHSDKDKNKLKDKFSQDNKKIDKDIKMTGQTSREDDDDNERRWEEVDKHIVKMTGRKNFNSGKVGNFKSDKPLFGKRFEDKHRSLSPAFKNIDRDSRFSDNYERYPRHFHNNSDVNLKKNNFPHHSDMHQQRMGQPNHMGPSDGDFRRDNMDFCRDNPDFRRGDFYDMHNQGAMLHSPGNSGYTNPSWSSQNTNMRNHPNSQFPNSGNMPSHQEMWGMGPNGPVDDYPQQHHMSNRFGPNRVGRPNNDLNFSDDIPLSPSQGPIPSLMSAPPMFPNPQFCPQFPAENRPFEPPFDHPNEFSQGPSRQWEPNRPNDIPFDRPVDFPRHQWDGQSNRPNEPSFDRPDFPHGPPRQPQWEPLSNRPLNEPNFLETHRGRGIDNAYGRGNNIDSPSWCRGGNGPGDCPPGRGRNPDHFPTDRGRPGEPALSGYNRRNEWDRPTNDSPNRFGHRDPRFRQEQVSQQPPAIDSRNRSEQPLQSTVNASTSSNVRRDPRLIKDNPHLAKTKDTSPVQRDPRRRNSDSKESNTCSNPNVTPLTNKIGISEKGKDANPNDEKLKKNLIDNKSSNEKTIKDKETMQSPLEHLYGVVDITAKTGKGYGFQKFKIPKIKRPEIVPRPPTPPKPSRASRDDDDWSSPIENKNTKSQDSKKIEVTSTTNENNDLAVTTSCTDVAHDSKHSDAEILRKEVPESVKTDESDEYESRIDTSTPSKKTDIKNQISPPKENDNEESLESFIKRSLESGEAWKLLEQAKFLRKLTVAYQTKNLHNQMKKKYVVSGSESNSSDSEETIKNRKKILKKKKSAVISDTSDEENQSEKSQQASPKSSRKNKKSQSTEKKEKLADTDVENEEEDNHDDDDKETKTNDNKSPTKKKKVTKKVKGKDKKSDELTIEDPENKEEKTQEVTSVNEEKKPRKFRRRNSLEMLQEDIREMFISEGVVTATGHRMCRLQKESEKNADGTEKSYRSIYVTSSPDGLDEDSSEEKSSKRVRSRSRARSRARSRGRSKSRTKLQDRARSKSRGRSKSRTRSKSRVRSQSRERSQSRTRSESRTRPQSRAKKNKTPECQDPEKPPVQRRKRNPKRSSKISKETVSSSDDENNSGTPKNDSNILNQTTETSISTNPEESANQDVESNEIEDSNRTLRRSERVAMKEPRIIIEKTELAKIDSSKIMFDTSSDESFAIDVPGLTAVVDISLHSEQPSSPIVNDPPTNSYTKVSQKTKKIRKRKAKETDKQSRVTPSIMDDDISMASDVSITSSNASSNKKTSSISTLVDNNEEVITNIFGNFVEDKNKETCNADNSDVDVEKDMDESESIKKPPIKRKKKKNTWQMGIVPRCKKKRSVNSNNETDEASSPLSIEQKSDVTADDSRSNTPIMTKSSESKKNIKNTSNSPKKSSSSSVNTTTILKDKEAEYPDLTLNQLIEYAWTGQEKYQCLLCPFLGKNIVHHYKSVHPKNEIMISRLTYLDAKRAIDESKDEIFIKCSEKLNSRPNRKFNCRFCIFISEGVKENAIEMFYEHCTTHTGEYRFTCKSCGYQTVSKSAIKTHYYKVCRKNCDNILLSYTEDSIPKEDYVPGFLCSLCNFIQLKEHNVQNHIDKLHKDISNVEIIKVNMSGFANIKDNKDFEEHFEEPVVKEDSDAISMDEDSNAKTEDSDEIEQKKSTKDNASTSAAMKNDVNQDEGENSVIKNFNAFVCPPELEKKEVEIQLERQKKMQQILNDLGKKLQKDSTKRVSIIDQLKDKMTTIGTESEPTQSINFERVENDKEDNITLQGSTILDENVKTEIQTDPLPVALNSSSVGSDEVIDIDKIDDDSNEGKSEKKLKDPLTSLQDDVQKSETEISDVEPTEDVNRAFDESDSSEDDLETEVSTDVNSLLKDAETINVPTKVSMMTTIQRLAAQLQSAKSFSATNSEDVEDNSHKESDVSENIVTRVPVITSVESLNRTAAEIPCQTATFERENVQGNEGPRNFIRLRRLSGDKLSNNQNSTESSIDEPIKENQKDTESSNEITANIPENEEAVDDVNNDCSFLKIENVVSLAQPEKRINSNNETIITDIRKAVGTPVRIVGSSVLKQPIGTNIVKKIHSVTTTEGLLTRLPPIKPAPAKNIKFLKVVRGLTVRKPKESPLSTVAPKLKTAEAYQMMLTALKLRHLYKCMARACTFTSDSMESFGKHFNQHVEMNERNKPNAVYDYQKCPYCSESFSTWDTMKAHYKSKHSFCSYQCSYCFYRAFTQSYVELHQLASHPIKPLSVILGMREYHVPEKVDVREVILPYVCKHACDKVFFVPEAFMSHLNTKHEPPLSIFYCHICPHSCLTSKQLVSHYKLHGLYKYQCLFCIFGADGLREMHSHLSVMHCNRPPKILERSLPPQPARDKDVLLQLIKRNLDESYKCTELKIINESVQESSAQKIAKKRQPRPSTTATSITPTIITAGKSTNPVPILPRPVQVVNQPAEVLNLLDRNIPKEFSGRVSTIIVKPNEITVKTASGFKDTGGVSVIKTPESKTDSTVAKIAKIIEKPNTKINTMKINPPVVDQTKVQLVHQECELEVRYANEQVKTKIANAVDPLSITEEDDLRCDEEFININLLDNPDILKSVEHSKSKELRPSDTNIANNDDDSDIEILEYIQHPNKTSTTTETTEENKTPPSSTNSDSLTLVETLEENSTSTESKNEKMDKSTVDTPSNDTESLKQTSESNIQTETKPVEDIVQPKTLEDIKDTGLDGNNLYKCGYPGCDFNTETPSCLKIHIKDCNFANEKKEVSCPHCNKKFVKVGYLLEHFKIHGLKRFGCSLCKYRCAMSYQASNHMKMKHKVGSVKMIPADPSNPSENGLFIIHPLKTSIVKIRGKKGMKIITKGFITEDKVSYSPSEIDSLPRQAVYNREVQCAICKYTNKVRSNIIRHLQRHAKDETVPESGPVNPVPCLDKKERMFDKMVNLASSSHQNGRMGGVSKEAVTPSEIESLPKYVPEHKRYVCSVPECNYLTVDETMLRCHLKALHSEEQCFRCPHCPAPLPGQESRNIPIDKMGVHLKIHDTRLYKCSHCNYHHYHRYVVERHLTDKHPEKRPFVKVIREIVTPENTQQSTTAEDNEDGPADKDGNYWKCNICDYKCVYKSEMVSHALSVHNEKAQFKCSGCPFKTTARMSLEQHIIAKHLNVEDIDYTLVFERIKGPRKGIENLEQSTPDEPFDTTPLWRRDMPRIRHIRGILLEDETEVSATETSVKATKRKSELELTSKPSKMIKTKSMDGTGSNEGKTKTDVKSATPDGSSELKEDIKQKLEDHFKKNSAEDLDSLDAEFYGKPDSMYYVCSLCPDYKSKFRQDIKEHLYRDLKYWRWHCKTCGYLTISQAQITKHVNRQHKNEKPDVVAIKSNPQIEAWVHNFLRKQWAMMRGISDDILSSPESKLTKLSPSTLPTNSSKPSPSKVDSTIISNNSEIPVIPSSTITSSTVVKTADLTETITNMPSVNKIKVNVEPDVSMEDDQEEDDDDDGDALIIDSREDVVEEIDKPVDKSNPVSANEVKEPGQTYVCKHCNTKFSRWRGFKLHIQINHLKRLGFLCPYCDRSTNSEGMMSQHIRAKHPGCPEEIIHNPAAGGPDLSDEFWEKEYGLVLPKKTKKRKCKSSSTEDAVDNLEKVGTSDICKICGFTAMNFTGLKAHMRAHANKHTLKCVYCSFTANSTSDVWQHSEINHPLSEWKAEEIPSPGSSESPSVHVYSKSNNEDYSKDIEEESIEPIIENVDTHIVFGCFYCNLRTTSLESVKTHWSTIHKDLNSNSKVKTGVPFRYKEIPVKISANPKLVKCGYCQKRGSLSQLRNHCKSKHRNLPLKFVEATDRSRDIWVCQWCNEVCETQSRNAHHNMFHSHLLFSFKIKHEIPMVQKGYVCPVCKFVSVSLMKMKTHVSKHYDKYKCKRCDQCFSSFALVTQHSTKEHPGLSTNIEGFVSNLDALMAGVSETDFTEHFPPSTDVPPPSNDIFRNLGVAKKSTTKQIVKPIATSIKAVARKSTNPLPRYPPGIVFEIGDTDNNVESVGPTASLVGFSYYGIPKEEVDLSNLNTTMAVGSARMKVKCTHLAQIINIEPRVVLKDIKKATNFPSVS
ncbi:uncharacterized protein [Chelonus insularis]|uniref:uncharacterized protein isoform X2 n=1 Tax=Chelonus insularis TaxID=460826 RepID=UPI00158E5636|nr:uncharacterized protein LOC118064908 isoform X2 [Chelonus insularis]